MLRAPGMAAKKKSRTGGVCENRVGESMWSSLEMRYSIQYKGKIVGCQVWRK